MLVTLFRWMCSWNPVPSAMWARVLPIERVSGAGAKSYLFSGISSAIFTVFSRTVRNAAAISLPP